MKRGPVLALLALTLAGVAAFLLLDPQGIHSALRGEQTQGGVRGGEPAELHVPVQDRTPGSSAPPSGEVEAVHPAVAASLSRGPSARASTGAEPRSKRRPGSADSRRPARVVGSVILEGIDLLWQDRIQVDAISDGGNTHTATIRSDGTFEFDLESEDVWHVCFTADCGHRIFESPEIVVGGGETVRPPSLQGIPVARYAAQVELRVLGPDLEPIYAQVELAAEIPNAHFGSWAQAADGTYKWATCTLEHEVRVSRDGLRSVELTLGPGSQEIVLEQGYRVRLVIDKRVRVPPGGWRLGATPFDGDRPVTPSGLLVFDSTGRVELRVPRVGEYRIEWSMRAPGSGLQRLLGPIEGATRSIEVRDTSELQEIELTVPNAALRTAAAGFGR